MNDLPLLKNNNKKDITIRPNARLWQLYDRNKNFHNAIDLSVDENNVTHARSARKHDRDNKEDLYEHM